MVTFTSLWGGINPSLWASLRLVQFRVLHPTLRSGPFAQCSLKLCLEHEQTLIKVKTELSVSIGTRAIQHSETFLQEGWTHKTLSKRVQVVMLRKIRTEAKTGGSQWWWQEMILRISLPYNFHQFPSTIVNKQISKRKVYSTDIFQRCYSKCGHLQTIDITRAFVGKHPLWLNPRPILS